MVKRECNSAHQARQTGLYGSTRSRARDPSPSKRLGSTLTFFTDDAFAAQGRYFCVVHPKVLVEHLVCMLPQQRRGLTHAPRGLRKSHWHTDDFYFAGNSVVTLNDHPRACTCG